MEKMHHKLEIITSILLTFSFISCISTTSPVMYTDNSNKEFVILGEVTYESNMYFPEVQKNGLTALLAAAKIKYKDCDYVIDIMIDKKSTLILFIFPKENYVMRGTAIQYIYRNIEGEIIPRPNISQNSNLLNALNSVVDIIIDEPNKKESTSSAKGNNNGNLNEKKDIILDSNSYIVNKINGTVQRISGIKYINVNEGDILYNSTEIWIHNNSSIVLSNGKNEILLSARQIGTIEEIIKRIVK